MGFLLDDQHALGASLATTVDQLISESSDGRMSSAPSLNGQSPSAWASNNCSKAASENPPSSRGAGLSIGMCKNDPVKGQTPNMARGPRRVNLRTRQSNPGSHINLARVRLWAARSSDRLLESGGLVITDQRFSRFPTKDANRARPVAPSQTRNSIIPHPRGLLASSRLLNAAASCGVGLLAAGDMKMGTSSSSGGFGR